MTESQLMDQVRLILGVEREGVWFRNNIGTAVMPDGARVKFGVGNPGGADLIGLYRGRFVAAELKSPDGRQSPDQRMWQRLVESKGGIYVVVRSVDDAHAWLERLRAEATPAR